MKVWLLSRYAWAVLFVVLFVPAAYFREKAKGGKPWRDGVLPMLLISLVLFVAEPAHSVEWFYGLVLGALIVLAVWFIRTARGANSKSKVV